MQVLSKNLHIGKNTVTNITFGQIVKDHFRPHDNVLPFFNSGDKQNKKFKVSLQGSFGNM